MNGLTAKNPTRGLNILHNSPYIELLGEIF